MTDITTRLSTALAGRYQIEQELGQGGMATVYLARDTKHERRVAIKVLRPELAAVIGAERFVQEIKTTANLQHPNILPLFDSGQAGEFLYYVMPFIEGESLRDKLDREKQLAVEETTEIARSVAAALDHAHRHGVIHRDIKPENVLINDGQALVADFGIALAVCQAGGERLTETGLSLGTPFYMSPEQATGDRELDARTDIYSLAAVTYEMFTGDPPHSGSTAQAVIASLVTEEPRPVTTRRPTVPSRVAGALHKALSKLPADRFGTAAEFARALGSADAVGTAPSIARSALPATSRPRDWRLTAALTAAVGFAGLALVLALRGPAQAAAFPVSRFTVPLPTRLGFGGLEGGTAIAVSPDGTRIVYAGRTDRGTQLYSRRLGDLSIEPIPDTEGAAQPFFSPDGRWIGFVADRGILRKVPAFGGPAVDILRFARTGISGPHWGDDDTIVFGLTGSLFRVGSTGGTVDTIHTADPQLLYWPHMLPGSQAALVTVGLLSPTGKLGVVDLATGDLTILLEAAGRAFYLPTGHIVYGHRSQALFAIPFDPASRTTEGEPRPVLQDIQVGGTGSTAGDTQFAASRAGTVVYLQGRGENAPRTDIVLTDLRGHEDVLAVDAPDGIPMFPRFSPDGGRLAFSTSDDIYVLELDVGATSRLTFEGQNFFPTWSPDGQYIAFTSLRPGTQDFDIHRRRSDGRGIAEQLTAAPLAQGPRVWLPDGRMLVVQVGPEGQYDLHVLDTAGTMVPYLTNRWNEAAPSFSPDFHWVAYVSDEAGRDEVYVSAFPDAAGRWQVSDGGGTDPFWDADGTLYYLHEGDLYAARVRTRPSVSVVGRRLVLRGPFVSGGRTSNVDREPGGGRFTLIRPAEDAAPPEITVVTNWFEELRNRLER